LWAKNFCPRTTEVPDCGYPNSRRREVYSDREDSKQPLSMLTFEVPLLTEHREPSILQEKNKMEVVGWTLFQLRNEVKIEIACFRAFDMYQ